MFGRRVRQWNEGNIPGVPDNVELQDAEADLSLPRRTLKTHSGCS